MATARARGDAGRTLRDTERRWLLDQMLRRQAEDPAVAEVAAGAEEASSVIVRPERVTSEPKRVIAGRAEPEPGAFAGPSLRGGLASPVPAAAPPARARAPAPPGAEPATSRPRRLADLAAPTTPRAPEPGPGIPRFSTRDAHRAAPAVDLRRYRAVFACCCTQARDAPTEESESG